MKKILIFSVALMFSFFALANTSVAEQGERQKRGHSPEERLSRMQEHLGLSDEQASAVRQIFEEARASCKDSEDRRECRHSQRETVGASIEGILDDEQLAKFKEHRQKRQERHAQRGQ